MTDLEDVVAEVITGRRSIRSAAREAGMPRSTFAGRVLRARAGLGPVSMPIKASVGKGDAPSPPPAALLPASPSASVDPRIADLERRVGLLETWQSVREALDAIPDDVFLGRAGCESLTADGSRRPSGDAAAPIGPSSQDPRQPCTVLPTGPANQRAAQPSEDQEQP